ncbi:hypothetical protein HW130_29285 [Streptomyces sp. PKU-EA00015]|uniref:hypothetical protein n=1 Tax=Streptomyces sp. PKU-EA00015 TaxID=2748326 RepID=UPI0015A03E43|nr:hypothetical protein [Streptomyces sp. PKU-EA00015]NWF30295.1 hypothetical protein [Streptomyces sp. PKU-EA00015]
MLVSRNCRSPRRDLDGTLREYAAKDGVELPPTRSVPNLFHRALTEPGARMMVGGAADVGFEGLMESWEATWPEGKEAIERIRTAYREAELAGVDLMAQSPMADGLRRLMRAVEQADNRLLCAAVRACTKASGTLAALALLIVPMAFLIGRGLSVARQANGVLVQAIVTEVVKSGEFEAYIERISKRKSAPQPTANRFHFARRFLSRHITRAGEDPTPPGA